MPDQSYYSALSRRSLLAALAVPLAAEPVKLGRKIRVAIVGLEGHTGEITDPLPNLPDVEVVAVSDADAASVKRFIHNHAAVVKARPYADYRSMLDAET